MEKKDRITVRYRLRRLFITGLAVLIPVIITFYAGFWLFKLINNLTGPMTRYFLTSIGAKGYEFVAPLVGFFFVVLIILGVGVLATHYMGKRIIGIGEGVLARIPFLRQVFLATKQFLTALNVSNEQAFSKVVLVEYPRPGIYAIGFITTRVGKQVLSGYPEKEEDVVYVFIPTTPNPTSGWLYLFKRKDTIALDMTVEAAIKLVISGGLVGP